MKVIFALTTAAARLGQRICRLEKDSILYVPPRLGEEFPQARPIQGSLADQVRELWGSCPQLIFIMAAGIVVRTIAPLLQDKTKDPAVVVLDEAGGYAVPLLSGHLGGANQLARELAAAIGAQAVITTATDVEGIPALDELARRNHCILENLQHWKRVALALLEGQPVALYSTVKLAVKFPANVRICRDQAELSDNYAGIIYITEEKLAGPPGDIPYVLLRPRSLVVGIGCRRGTPAKEILSAIKEELAGLALCPSCIAALASIDLKKEEAGLIAAAGELAVQPVFYDSATLAQTAGAFSDSPFVRKVTGTGAVAEPAAWLTAAEPLLLKGKTRYPGITIAIVKDQSLVIS